MREFTMTLAEALTSPMTATEEVEQIYREAKTAGRGDIAKIALAELERRKPNPHWIVDPDERAEALEEAIARDAAPCDGGPSLGDVR